jgi:flagellar hook assembly protein FlgD
MDEVRIQNALRDSNWIRLEYENQKANQSLVWTTQPPVGIAGSSAARAATFGFTAKALGDGMLFRIDGTEDARRARVALVDMWGRTVWSHTATTAAGMNQVLWNGQANNGSLVSSGVYVVRVSLFDARNKVTATSERRVPLTR